MSMGIGFIWTLTEPNGLLFILNSNEESTDTDIISGIGAFVVYAVEQAAKQYSVVRLMFNHGQQCKENFYSLYKDTAPPPLQFT